MEVTSAFFKDGYFSNEYTALHSARVSAWSFAFGMSMRLSLPVCENTRLAGALHDIGKYFVPPAILFKPSGLTETEWTIVHQHPADSFQMSLKYNLPPEVLLGIIFHHENWEGNGYPFKLKEDGIPLIAQILHIVDDFDALMADRPYRVALPTQEAVKIIVQGAGKRYNPGLVRYFGQFLNQKLVV